MKRKKKYRLKKKAEKKLTKSDNKKLKKDTKRASSNHWKRRAYQKLKSSKKLVPLMSPLPQCPRCKMTIR